jgi:hypothetical protein
MRLSYYLYITLKIDNLPLFMRYYQETKIIR